LDTLTGDNCAEYDPVLWKEAEE